MQQRRFILPNPRRHHSHHRLEGDSKVSWGRNIFFSNLSLTKALDKLVTASTSNDLRVRNHLSPFYVWGKGLRQVITDLQPHSLPGLMLRFQPIHLASNPVLFPLHCPGWHTSWLVRGPMWFRDWRKILAGTNGKAKTLLPYHPDRTFGAGKTLHQAPSGTWQGDLQFFDEDNSFPSSLWFLTTHGLLHAPTLLLNETLAFEVCFTMRGLSSVLP